MLEVPAKTSATQHTRFNIDLEQLGCFLAEAFIHRLDAFVSLDRIVILTACRKRLAAEGGDIEHYLLEVPAHPFDESNVSGPAGL